MTRIFAVAVAGLLAVQPALAQEPSPAERAHEMRTGLMHNMSFNLGPLVQMARGETEYDAEAAALHAGNIAELASVNLMPYWVEGSSTEELEDSRALPAIWENMEDVEAKRMDLVEAAEALVPATGEGQEAFVAAFRSVGDSCGSCHEDYREPDE